MEWKTTAVAAAALACGLGTTPARAETQGIIVCQIALGQFAEDAAAAKARLEPRQLDQARQVVDVGRSQCRSGPQLTMTDIRSARMALDLPGRPGARVAVDNAWSIGDEDVAQLQ